MSDLNAALAAPGARTEKVWVGVRIRPLLRHEVDSKETVAWRASGPGVLACLAEEKNSYTQSTYQYDRVFSDACSSEEVYSAAAQPMVRSAMEGYNCTLFAYGQTGSGKTTTMRSVMRHAAKDIFAHIAHTRDRDFVLKMSAIEVYNEVVHDLFVDADTSLRINDDKERGPVVVDLTEQSIESEEHLLKMLKAVEGRRTVRETRMNQKSSRSHMVVRLYVESRPTAEDADDDSCDGSSGGEDASSSGDDANAVLAPPVLSTINFVDLAGSERLNQASTDDADREKLRQKEASNINVSLLTLGKVIRALGKRGEHVPYRESNLTRILQPSLSGNSRMAIVCTLSPAAGCVENSRAALHFANHAKAVTMRPVLNEVRDEQALIRKMEVEITELRRKLAKMDRPTRSSRQEAKQLLAEKDAELKAKEEQMRQALQDRVVLEKRLNQMEKFIIRGGSGSPAPGVRRSFDDLDALTASVAQPSSAQAISAGRGGMAGMFAGAGGALSMRASWNPTTSPLDARERTSAGKQAKPAAFLGLGRSVNPGRLLLDYILPPGVRDAVARLGGESQAARPAAVPFALSGQQDALAARGATSQPPALNLRSELSKLQMQAPGGVKAQEALSALQAEVRCYSQQPNAAAVVAAAAGATPDTADRLLEQLTAMLGDMEQRQRDTQAAMAASNAGTPGDAAATSPLPSASMAAAMLRTAAAVSSASKEAAGAGGGAAAAGRAGQEDEVSLMVLLRAEVARLKRLQAAHAQANAAIESLLSKMAVLEQGGAIEGGANTAMDGAAQMPEMLERLQSALAEADVLAEGEEEEEVEAEEDAQQEPTPDAAQQAGPAGAAGTNAARPPRGTPAQRRVPAAGDGEACSSQRYDSPAPAAAGSGAGPPPQASPMRRSGSKLPRSLLPPDTDAEDAAGALLKSPRLNLMASPHASASAMGAAAAAAPVSQSAGAVAGATNTPNSRGPRLDGVSASVGAALVAAAPPPSRPAPGAPPSDSGRPAAAADDDDHALRRMRTPSLSMQASEGDMSGGRRTASVSSRGGLLRWDTDRAKRIISREKDAIHTWYSAEVARLKSVFRQQAAKDVESMKEAVGHYRGMFEETQERVERLHVQKQLLINQVLMLEVAVEEAEQQDAQKSALIATLAAERDQARYEAAQAQDRARAALLQAQKAQAAAAQAALQPPVPNNEQHAFVDDDDWADGPTTETLLTEICELWHKLHVPLVYRGRFFLLFRSKELIYLQMEQRRLKHRLEQIEKDMDTDFYLARSKSLDKAKRALDLERKVLAQALRHTFGDRDREALYDSWGVQPNSKGRKLQLVKRLWDPAITCDQAGMEASAQVTCALAGPDATEQFMQLVFGNTAEAVARPTQVGALMSTLVRRVTTPRHRKSSAPGVSAAPTASGYYAPTSGGGTQGGVTPRRQSSSLLANLTGRVGSFFSQSGGRGATTPNGGGPPPLQPGNPNFHAAGAASSTPRHTPPPVPPLALGAMGSAAAGAAGPDFGPMTRGLTATTPLPSARGPAPPIPPLPPPHPGTATYVSGTPPLSARGGRPPPYGTVPSGRS